MYDVYSCGFDGVIVRPKRVHKQIILIFAKDFACHGSHGYARENFANRWAGAVGGGRGRVNPPPRRLVWRFWRFGGFGAASKPLHA